MKKYLLYSAVLASSLYGANPAVITPMPLMKGSVTIVQNQGDKELTWVDEQIQAILPARIGIPNGYINALNDPIKYKAPVPKPETGAKLLAPPKLGGGAPMLSVPKIVEEPLRLQALFNKTALISGKWYHLNDTVRSYSLAEIKVNSILLTGQKDQKLILFLSKQNNNIKITTK